jgi:hypothetical protein
VALDNSHGSSFRKVIKIGEDIPLGNVALQTRLIQKALESEISRKSIGRDPRSLRPSPEDAFRIRQAKQQYVNAEIFVKESGESFAKPEQQASQSLCRCRPLLCEVSVLECAECGDPLALADGQHLEQQRWTDWWVLG